MPWRRAQQPTTVFLPGESHGQRTPVVYSPWGHKALDMTESTDMCMHTTLLLQCLLIKELWRDFPGSLGFPDSSVGKESACNAGDPGLIPGSGRSTREGLGYPHQYSWASFVAQLVKNPPAIYGTWVQSLEWEELLEERTATHSSILASRIPWTV